MDEEDLAPENPRVSSPPPPPDLKNPKIRPPPPNLKNPKIRRKIPRADPLRHYRVTRRKRGWKLADEEDLRPVRSPTPPPSPTRKTLHPALPVPAAVSPDRSDPKIFRRLPKYWFRYRTLPDWANVGAGVVAAGSSEAAPSEEQRAEARDSDDDVRAEG